MLTPVTTPPEVMVATDVVPLVQVPPAVALESVMLLPTFTEELPDIAATVGIAITATEVVVAVVVPQLLVADNVYTPADTVPTVNAAGVRLVEEKLLGPLHE